MSDLIRNFIEIITNTVIREYRLKQLRDKRKKLLNKNFTIIANNCIGGIIYKDLGLPFLSPTINLLFYAPDYIKFLSRMDYYLSIDMINASKSKYGDFNYPIGLLNDIEVHFVHYSNYEEARDKWEERKKRVNKDNIFIIGSDIDLCTPAIIEEFDNLPYDKKIFLSSQHYPQMHSVVWLKEYQNRTEIIDIIPTRGWLKYIKLIAWFNKETDFIYN